MHALGQHSVEEPLGGRGHGLPPDWEDEHQVTRRRAAAAGSHEPAGLRRCACRQATRSSRVIAGLEAVGGQVDQVDLVAAGLGAADGGSCYRGGEATPVRHVARADDDGVGWSRMTRTFIEILPIGRVVVTTVVQKTVVCQTLLLS